METRTQHQNLKSTWTSAMPGMNGASEAQAWSDTLDAWQRSVMQAFDLQTAWSRGWTEGLETSEAVPEQLREVIRQGQEVVQLWTKAQPEICKNWFELLKNLNSATDPESVAPARPNVMQIWRDGMQRLIDAQAQWAAPWMKGAQEMYGITTETAEAVAPAEQKEHEPVGTPAPEATGSDELAPSEVAPPYDGGVHAEEDRRTASAVEVQRAVESSASGAQPVMGFPHSSGRDALIQAIMNAAKTDAEQATQAVDVILGTIATALAEGDEVRLPRFGSFKVIQTQARVGSNPRTKEPISIPAGRKAVFRPGSELRKAVAKADMP